MTIRTISHNEALLGVRDEIVYTESRLLKDERAAEFAALFSALKDRWTGVFNGQLQAWDAETVAQAGVDAGDDNLDDTVNAIDGELVHADGAAHPTPRYKRYFVRPRNEIVRLGLETELERVRAWPASLKTEPEAPIQTLGTRLEANVVAGSSAVGERRQAAANTADHRVREILRFIDDLNATRLSVYGKLVTRGQEAGSKFPKSWPNRFFRRTERAVKQEP